MEQPSGSSSNKTIYILLFFIIIVGGAMLYYIIGPRKSTLPSATKNPNDPLNQKIPGITPGDKALGILTDKDFFAGLNSIANNIYDKIKKPSVAGAGALASPVADNTGLTGTGGTTVLF